MIIQDPKIRVTTVDCWATPEKDPHGDLQHFLIEDGCGVDGVLDGTLQIIENGQSKMAKWAGAVFQFVGYEEVWLHCDIRVCFNDADCIPTCQQGLILSFYDIFQKNRVRFWNWVSF